LFHRRIGKGGYRIAHTMSATPEDPDSWPPAVDATRRPVEVRAQELTAAVYHGGRFHLFIIEHTFSQGIKIAHLAATKPEGPFEPANPKSRYLPPTSQPGGLAYSGHITPVLRDGRLLALFWTARQSGKRYGLLGHPVGIGALR
ncbi:MAG: hypothetical protein U9N87_08965, partial [Planctomycetota bacterium]|nr:hypothetical protein [Planctomycetota bacterium]